MHSYSIGSFFSPLYTKSLIRSLECFFTFSLPALALCSPFRTVHSPPQPVSASSAVNCTPLCSPFQDIEDCVIRARFSLFPFYPHIHFSPLRSYLCKFSLHRPFLTGVVRNPDWVTLCPSPPFSWFFFFSVVILEFLPLLFTGPTGD